MPTESLLVQIRQRLNFEEFFGEFLTMRGRGAERAAFCLFHENTDTPSLGVNIEDGLYTCRNPACGAGGDFIDLFMRVRSLTFPEAVRELARRVGLDVSDVPAPDRHVIDESIASAAHDRLLATPAALTLLQERRGLSLDTIRRWQLGHDGDRYYIPIRDEAARLVNIRRYRPNAARAQDKMISWRTGYGVARLWPYDALLGSASDILLCEGEMDTLLALQLGFNAMTTTGGAGTWREPWSTLFRGRNVTICYDVDDAGRLGALTIAQHLHAAGATVKVAHLPLTEPVGADITDFIVGHGHTDADLAAIIRTTAVFTPAPGEAAPDVPPEPVTLHLSQASRAEHYNQPIRVPVMVSGKTTAPYLIPKTITMRCVMPGLPMCGRCPVATAAGRLTHTLEFNNNELLQFIDISDQQLGKLLKAKIGVPSKCTYAEPDVSESLNIEALQVIPEIDRTEQDAPYVTRLCYYVGHGLQPNRSYIFTGLTVPDPRHQLATHLIHAAVPSQSNIDAFRLTEDVIGRLRAFAPDGPGVSGLWAKLTTVYDDLEQFTRIYQRRDLMLAVDLTFHSALSFTLQGERLVRGWVEALIIGDSRTGKTTIVQRLTDYYRAGEFGSGENTSLAGLIGGLHQVGDSWALQWGKIPLNDRRLFVIDEAGNLPPEQIARMSSMRSSGIAEVIKVHTERTNSRTRQIWISNPRGMKPLSSYSQGVLAVKELIGAPEDVARFDLVVTAASQDVDLAIINQARRAQAPTTYTSELCHQRVMWAWSRMADDVQWTDGTEALILQRATEQGERYRHATEIPLVEPNEQRVKIARLAVAAAILFFSTETGREVLVRPEHVEFAVQFISALYAKPSLAFDDYAAARRRTQEMTNPGAVAEVLTGAGVVQQLMEQEQFTQRDLAEILRLDDRARLRDVITTLRNAGFLQRYGTTFYYKTPAAIRFLRGMLTTAGPSAGLPMQAATLTDQPDF